MPKIPAHLGRYRLIRLLGQGGMGQVFEAVQQGLERHVALKVLPPQYLSQSGFLKRFHREARAAAMLSHPNVVAVATAAACGYVSSSATTWPVLAGRVKPS